MNTLNQFTIPYNLSSSLRTNTTNTDKIESDTDIVIDPKGSLSGNVTLGSTDKLKTNTLEPIIWPGGSLTINGAILGPVTLPNTINVDTINEKTLNNQLLLQTTGTNNVGIENFTFKDNLLSNVNDITISTTGTTKNIDITPTGNIRLNGLTLVDSINEKTTNGDITLQTVGSGSLKLISGSSHTDIQENLHIYDSTLTNKFIDFKYDGLTDAGYIGMYDANHALFISGGSTTLNGAYVNLSCLPTKDVFYGCDNMIIKNNLSTVYYGKFNSAGLSVDTIQEYTTDGQLLIKTNGTNNVGIENFTFKDNLFSNANDIVISTTGTTKNIDISPTGVIQLNAVTKVDTINVNTINERTAMGPITIQTTGTNSVMIENTKFKDDMIGMAVDTSSLNISGGIDTTGGFIQIYGKTHATKANFLELTNLAIYPNISAGTLTTFAGLTSGGLLASGLPTLGLISNTNTNRIPYSNGTTLTDASTFTYDGTTLTSNASTFGSNTWSNSDTLIISTTGTTKDIKIIPTGDTYIEDVCYINKPAVLTSYLKLFYNSVLSRPSVGTNANTEYLELIGGPDASTNSNITMGYGSSIHFINNGCDAYNIGSIGNSADYASFDASTTELKKALKFTGTINTGTVKTDGWLALDTSGNVIRGTPPDTTVSLPLSGVTTTNTGYVPYSNGTNLIESANMLFSSNSLQLGNGAGTDNYKPFFAVAGSLASNKLITMELEKDGTHYGYSGYLYNATAPQTVVGLVDGGNSNAIQMYLDKVNLGPQLNLLDSTSTTSMTPLTVYESGLTTGNLVDMKLGTAADNCLSVSYYNDTGTDANKYVEFKRLTSGGGSTYLRLVASGYVQIQDPGGAVTCDQIGIDGSGNIRRWTSSSLRYKYIIDESVPDFYTHIDKLVPKMYKLKGDKGTKFESEVYCGYVAEELDLVDGFEKFVKYDNKSNTLPDSIKYDMLSVAALECVKKQKKEINELKSEVTRQRKIIDNLEKRLITVETEKIKIGKNYDSDILELQYMMKQFAGYISHKKKPVLGKMNPFTKKITEYFNEKNNNLTE
jgi:hypothetical protein